MRWSKPNVCDCWNGSQPNVGDKLSRPMHAPVVIICRFYQKTACCQVLGG